MRVTKQYLSLAGAAVVLFLVILNASMAGAADLYVHTITSPPRHVNEGGQGSEYVTCPAGEKLTGGGYMIDSGNIYITRQMQADDKANTWIVEAYSPSGGGDFRSSAQCASIVG